MVDTSARSPVRDSVALGVSLLAVVLTAGLGGFAANSAQEYGSLQQPSWAPPSWLFGPVWTVLYAAMAVAAWLVWRSGPITETRAALTAYAAHCSSTRRGLHCSSVSAGAVSRSSTSLCCGRFCS